MKNEPRKASAEKDGNLIEIQELAGCEGLKLRWENGDGPLCFVYLEGITIDMLRECLDKLEQEAAAKALVDEMARVKE